MHVFKAEIGLHYKKIRFTFQQNYKCSESRTKETLEKFLSLSGLNKDSMLMHVMLSKVTLEGNFSHHNKRL